MKKYHSTNIGTWSAIAAVVLMCILSILLLLFNMDDKKKRVQECTNIYGYSDTSYFEYQFIVAQQGSPQMNSSQYNAIGDQRFVGNDEMYAIMYYITRETSVIVIYNICGVRVMVEYVTNIIGFTLNNSNIIIATSDNIEVLAYDKGTIKKQLYKMPDDITDVFRCEISQENTMYLITARGVVYEVLYNFDVVYRLHAVLPNTIMSAMMRMGSHLYMFAHYIGVYDISNCRIHIYNVMEKTDWSFCCTDILSFEDVYYIQSCEFTLDAITYGENQSCINIIWALHNGEAYKTRYSCMNRSIEDVQYIGRCIYNVELVYDAEGIVACDDNNIMINARNNIYIMNRKSGTMHELAILNHGKTREVHAYLWQGKVYVCGDKNTVYVYDIMGIGYMHRVIVGEYCEYSAHGNQLINIVRTTADSYDIYIRENVSRNAYKSIIGEYLGVCYDVVKDSFAVIMKMHSRIYIYYVMVNHIEVITIEQVGIIEGDCKYYIAFPEIVIIKTGCRNNVYILDMMKRTVNDIGIIDSEINNVYSIGGVIYIATRVGDDEKYVIRLHRGGFTKIYDIGEICMFTYNECYPAIIIYDKKTYLVYKGRVSTVYYQEPMRIICIMSTYVNAENVYLSCIIRDRKGMRSVIARIDAVSGRISWVHDMQIPISGSFTVNERQEIVVYGYYKDEYCCVGHLCDEK